jgi:hypothetical protein
MSNTGEIEVPFHGGKLSVPKDVAINAWLDKVMGRTEEAVRSVPRIGEVWPGQGGFNGGLARHADGRPYWLIVSPDTIGAFGDVEWGDYGVDVPGAKDEFDGLANTQALIATGDHLAARKCGEVEFEGHRDYYVPSKRESAVLYANVPDLFIREWHWTSTQYSANGAWYQGFAYGGQGADDKSYKGRVRAVRRLDF